MNKQIAIILGIFLISLAGAVDYNISAGDTISFDLNQTYAYYSVEGISETDINISQNETIVKIETNKYMQSDYFEITFFDEKGEEIHTYSSGGGSSKTTFVTDNNLNEELSELGYSDLDEEELEEIAEEPKKAGITGAVIGTLTSITGIIVLAFLMILITGYLFVRKYLKKKNK